MITFDTTPFDTYWKSIGNETQNEICKDIEDKKTFGYDICNVTFENFSENYCPKGWLGRKFYVILGLPSALISALVYLFAAALDGKLKEIAKFSCQRSLQIALGQLITIRDDQKGQYYMQKGLFHIACYMKSYQNQWETDTNTVESHSELQNEN